MQCPQCQHENSATAKFCEECGQLLRARCPACSFESISSTKCCPECDQRLAPPTPSSETRGSLTAPQAHTPKHLAEKILTARSALEGEHKQVTVWLPQAEAALVQIAF